MMRRRFSPLRAMPIAGTLLMSPAQAQDPQTAQQGPIPDPVSAAANPHPLTAAPRGEADARGGNAQGRTVRDRNVRDRDAAGQGRRIVSTAFVRLGPDGRIELATRDGRVLVLRGVTMEPGTVCGITVSGGTAGKRRCIDYAQVTQARPADIPAGLDPVDAGPGRRATDPR